jgi:multidrug efflux system outer membrane protein
MRAATVTGSRQGRSAPSAVTGCGRRQSGRGSRRGFPRQRERVPAGAGLSRKIDSFSSLQALMLLLVLFVAGCTLGRDAVRPVNAASEAASFANAGPADEVLPALDRWWERLGDPATAALVEQALANNADLRAAAGRVLEARAALGIARGERLPAVDLSLDADRSQRTFDFSGERFSIASSTYTLRGTARWQLDLFGKLRRQQEAQWYRLLASEASRDALLQSVIAEVVRARSEVATLERRAEVARSRSESFARTAELVESRVGSDLASGLDLEAARESLAESRAAEPELEYRLAAARHALDVLAGRRPGRPGTASVGLAPLPPRQRPPVGVPLALLDRRPDLRSTELASMARQAEIGVALAELYPDLTIDAGAGLQSSSFDELFDFSSDIWSIAGSLATKIFRGGTMRAGVDAAEARAEIAAAEYAGAVLGAMREVEDALVRDRTAWESYGHLEARLSSARSAASYADARYEAGLESLLDVLEQRRRSYAAEDALLQMQQTLWDARLGLILALGGDWHASAVEAAAQPEAPGEATSR